MRLPSRFAPLRPYLLGSANREGEWQMYCPLHGDQNSRSASLNIKSGVWHCFAGCGGGKASELIDRREEWKPPPGGHRPPPEDMADDDKPPLSNKQARRWAKDLLGNDGALDRLQSARGLYEDTIRNYRIGWDGRTYTIPIYDGKGELVNVRHYNLGGNTSRKIWNTPGHGSPSRLYPFSALKDADDFIIICEGELDALITNQAGFPTITRTAGATEWTSGWAKLFAGRRVYICQDRDEAGEQGTLKIGRSLLKEADEVRIIRLPYPVVPKGGKDLTDFWMDNGGTHAKAIEKFQRLISEAQLFDAKALQPREVDPSDADAIDALNAELHSQPLRLTLTVKGKARGGYTLPHKIDFSCGQDAGAICSACPLQGSGSGSLEIERKNPALLQMLGSTTTDVDKQIKNLAGIPPRCPKVALDKTFQSVEILFARPSVEHVNGSRVDFTPLRLTSVGRHNTPSNCTVQVVGALHNNPRNQENEFLAWDVSELRTLDDEFSIDKKALAGLKVFRPKGKQKPLAKLREIADELAYGVTHIYGRPHLHAAMDLVWHSVLGFRFQGELITRGWLELLVAGDTRTGKSEVAQKLIRYYQAGELVNCEAASFAGVVGGTQQLRNEWMLTWGVIPVNDRRLVVMDEISGLSVDEIGAMSSVRSSGVASISKIVSEETPARTRLIWMGNPRDDVTMSNYSYGVYAIKPLIGRAEDIARFDMALTLNVDDVDVATALAERREASGLYSREACSTLVRWAWTRKPEDVVWQAGAEDEIIAQSKRLGDAYISDPPLILRNDLRIKLARIAVAIAARLFSSKTGEDLYVTKAHARAAAEFLDSIYSQPTFGYRDLSDMTKKDAAHADEHHGPISQYLSEQEQLARFLHMLPEGRFYSRDLEEVLGISREQANAIINRLISARMMVKDRGAVRMLPQLQRVLKGVLR